MYDELLKRLDEGDEDSRWAASAIRHLQGHYSDLNEEAIGLAREMLEEHLGISAAFFDDCVMLAIQRCLKAEENAAESL